MSGEATTMAKVIRDGKVAVLYSPHFGSGWFTWNAGHPGCLFDPDIVALVERGASGKEIAAVAEAKYPHFYAGGANDLRIKWLPEGTPFRVDEYDGNESIVTSDELIQVA